MNQKTFEQNDRVTFPTSAVQRSDGKKGNKKRGEPKV